MPPFAIMSRKREREREARRKKRKRKINCVHTSYLLHCYAARAFKKRISEARGRGIARISIDRRFRLTLDDSYTRCVCDPARAWKHGDDDGRQKEEGQWKVAVCRNQEVPSPLPPLFTSWMSHEEIPTVGSLREKKGHPLHPPLTPLGQ